MPFTPMFGSTIIPAPAQPSTDALANALAAGPPLSAPIPPDELRRRHTMANALTQPQQSMTSPMQVLAAGVNGGVDGYVARQAQEAQAQAAQQATAQASGVQGPIQPASAIADQNALIPSFDLSSLFARDWGN